MITTATLCSITVGLLLIVQPGKAQNLNMNMTFHCDKMEPKAALLKLSDEAGLPLSIDAGALDGAKLVTIHIDNKSFFYVLEMIGADQPFICFTVKQIMRVSRRTLPVNLTSGNKLISTWGQFIDERGEGVANVNVYTMGNTFLARSFSNGRFYLTNTSPRSVYKYWSKLVDTGSFMLGEPGLKIPVSYRTKIASLEEIEVIQTGIQQILKKRDIGSSFVVTSEVLQQRASPNIFDRLEGVVPSWQLTVNNVPNTYQPKYGTLGGRTTIFSEASPLVVLDNFPYEGRWEDINWEDVQTVTALRDASKTSLWGAMAANGVVVITTKSGKFNHPLRVSFNASISAGLKPDLFAKDMLPPSQRLFLDTLLAGSYYSFLARSPGNAYVPEVGLRKLQNSISDEELAGLEKQDVRNDMKKYFYRNIFQHHFSLQMTGGGKKHAYFFSVGWDHSLPELRLSHTQRLSLMANYTSHPIEGLEITVNGASAYSRQHNIDNLPEIPVTYSSLVDSLGRPAVQSYKRLKYFIDTAGVDPAGQRKLKEWTYKPLQEFRIRNHNKIQFQQRVQISVKYNRFSFLKGLEVGLYGQYQGMSYEEKDLKDKESFYVNDLVNSFSQLSGSDVFRPIPWGNIMDYSISRIRTGNIRAQVAYVKSLGKSGVISAMLGSDRIFTKSDFKARRIYDYTPERQEGAGDLNYHTLFPQYYFPASSLYIPYRNDAKRTANNYISYYAYTNLQVKGKYFASVVARADYSNIYGPKTNRRVTPLGSVAGAWDISNEDIFKNSFVDFLKLRSSIGLSGNPPQGMSAVQTLSMTGKNENGDPIADINNPPLPNLQWETVMTYNLGLNFRLIRNIIEGSVDYYYKTSTGLIGLKWVDPTTGTASIRDNVASMAARNIDINLVTRNLNKILRWKTTFVFSLVKDYVTKTDTALQAAWVYCDQNRFSVVQGHPLFGIYSFPSMGLDETGDPIGPNKNKDYAAMTLSQGSGSLHYWGRSLPPLFGSLTNEFNWKRFNLVFMFTYKLNYYYRKPGVNYTGIFDGSDLGVADFSRRWQKPGDENHTTVPRMQIPANPYRDYFYLYSDKLVRRADFIRLQNIYFSYDLEGAALRKLQMRLASLYVICTNAGIVRRATKSNLDPDRLQGFPQPTILSIGFKGTFK